MHDERNLCNSSVIVVHWSYMANGLQELNTRQTCVTKTPDGRFILGVDVSDLGWRETPQIVRVTSHKTGDTREFMFLHENVREGDVTHWTFVSPTQTNTLLHVFND